MIKHTLYIGLNDKDTKKKQEIQMLEAYSYAIIER